MITDKRIYPVKLFSGNKITFFHYIVLTEQTQVCSVSTI